VTSRYDRIILAAVWINPTKRVRGELLKIRRQYESDAVLDSAAGTDRWRIAEITRRREFDKVRAVV
jgi:hypothetical protein